MTETIVADISTPADLSDARNLIEEYASAIDIDLGFQNFFRELEVLDDVYRPPGGCLLLARRDDTAVGCVALRPFRSDVCEMKRLYVLPDARGAGIGRALAEGAIRRARRFGYRTMVLDTLESMTAARGLYRSLGFRKIPPYYDNPIDGAVYMALDLDRART